MPSVDLVVALLGVVMAAALLSRNSALRSVPLRSKAVMAAIWVAIFGAGVLIVALLQDRI